MRALKFVPFVLAVASLSGLAQEPSAPTPQKSVVYFYRYKQFVGSALAPSVYCDEAQLARMENGRYFAVNIEPGRHTFRSNDAQSGIQLDVKPGQEYYVRVELVPGMMKGHGRLVLTAAEQGRYELQSNKLKPLDANKVVDASRVSVAEANFTKPLPPATPAGTGSTNSGPKPTTTSRPSQDEATPVNEVTLSDTPPDTGSQMSLGDAARTAKQKKAATDNTTAPPQ
jgi:hypothetical protein